MNNEIEICKGCGHSKMIEGNICPICCGLNNLSGQFIKIIINPDEIKCSYCGKKLNTEVWKIIPYYDHNSKSFYCGCRGWD